MIRVDWASSVDLRTLFLTPLARSQTHSPAPPRRRDKFMARHTIFRRRPRNSQCSLRFTSSTFPTPTTYSRRRRNRNRRAFSRIHRLALFFHRGSKLGGTSSHSERERKSGREGFAPPTVVPRRRQKRNHHPARTRRGRTETYTITGLRDLCGPGFLLKSGRGQKGGIPRTQGSETGLDMLLLAQWVGLCLAGIVQARLVGSATSRRTGVIDHSA